MIKGNANSKTFESLTRDLNGRLCYSLNLTAEELEKPGQGIGNGENIDHVIRSLEAGLSSMLSEYISINTLLKIVGQF